MNDFALEILGIIILVMVPICEIILVSAGKKLNRYVFAAMVSFIMGAAAYEGFNGSWIPVILISLGMGIIVFFRVAHHNKVMGNQSNDVS